MNVCYNSSSYIYYFYNIIYKILHSFTLLFTFQSIPRLTFAVFIVYIVSDPIYRYHPFRASLLDIWVV